MKPVVTIAVASDLHCHAPREAGNSSFLRSGESRTPRGQHPLESIAHLIDIQKLAADILLCPGDLTDKVCPQGIQSAWDALKELRELLGAQILVATTGNHDVDSHGQLGPDPLSLAKGFRPREFPTANRELIEKYWSRGFCIVPTPKTDILLLNSVADHFNPDTAKRGSVSNALLEKLEETIRDDCTSPQRIAVVHHHPLAHDILGLGAEDVMQNGDALLTILEKFSFRLIVHGHKHHPRLRYSPNTASGPTVFAAGSFSSMSPELLSNTRNLFHLVELHDDLPGCVGPGTVRSWEFNFTRGWSEPSPRSADFPSIAGFGCRTVPRELASRIAPLADGQVNSWAKLLDQVPSAAFLLPTDLVELGRELGESHNLQLWPKPPERPEQVTALRGSNG